ncbi:sulfite exporter TauE/SafE family protein [uncultured Azohydromonas sp.]|jgi:Sulfite exporter TauE/SafE.|uniref:sulfite exporter TauE/SafE family protein n=1 Tax=uncultured Azohydromonas sp. TaxID=487342 RepID=UPI0026107691|nr:sulfite exporter TauE/SafE family protein [uncultured Azohydromonas sp.]
MTGPEMATAAAVFLAGGMVKGTLGIGLPLVAVPLLSLFMPATQAIALVAMPVLVSNAWQAFDSGDVQGLRRFLPLIATQLVATLLTVPMTLALSPRTLNAVLGAVVLLAVVLLCLPLRLHVPPARERWWSAGIGALSGAMGGVSSLTGPLIISYLTSLRLPREAFIGSISLIYLGSSIPLYASMAAHGRLGGADLALSTLALAPVACGLTLGKRLRLHLSEVWFRRVLLAFLAAVAVTLALK